MADNLLKVDEIRKRAGDVDGLTDEEIELLYNMGDFNDRVLASKNVAYSNNRHLRVIKIQVIIQIRDGVSSIPDIVRVKIMDRSQEFLLSRDSGDYTYLYKHSPLYSDQLQMKPVMDIERPCVSYSCDLDLHCRGPHGKVLDFPDDRLHHMCNRDVYDQATDQLYEVKDIPRLHFLPDDIDWLHHSLFYHNGIQMSAPLNQLQASTASYISSHGTYGIFTVELCQNPNCNLHEIDQPDDVLSF